MKRARIVVTGPDGSGKSTACAALVERLRARGVAAAEVTVWDAIDARKSPLAPAFKGKAEANQYLAELDGFARTLFIFHALARAIQLAERTDAQVLVLNGYWYKYAVSELGYGVASELVFGAARGFARPDATLYLDIDPETARERRPEATRYEGGEKFTAFQRKLGEHWLALEAAVGPWTRIDAKLPPGEVARKLEEEALKWLV